LVNWFNIIVTEFKQRDKKIKPSKRFMGRRERGKRYQILHLLATDELLRVLVL
jgi:hypothetical protein